MKLTLAEKLGLIYTAGGSQRKVASVVGLSHQTVGRILHKAMQGESLANYEKRPDIVAAVERGFASHTAVAKMVAKRDGIPFRADLPVYVERMKRRNSGKQSDRTLAQHTHWLSDRVRNAWIKASQESGKYLGVTVRSKVRLRDYSKGADRRAKAAQLGRTKAATFYKEQIKKKLREGVEVLPVFTPTTRMDAAFPSSLVIADLEDKLRSRHQPATGTPGTAYADEIIMQFDTRKHANKSGQAKQGKAGKSKGAARRATR